MQIQLVADSPVFLKWEHDWLVDHCLGDFDVRVKIDSSLKVTDKHTILLIREGTAGRLQHIREAVRAARLNGFQPVMIHLNDEWATDDLSIYDACDLVFRNYYRAEAAKMPNCFLFPLGYRSGFREGCLNINFAERQIPWVFVGDPKGERRRMLSEAAAWAEGTTFLTKHWDDPQALSAQEYARLLSKARFAPCPFGNCSPESFRLYEALEAGAVPVVQDLGGGPLLLLQTLEQTYSVARNSPRKAARRIKNMFEDSYWTRQFGPGFPVPRVRDWTELKPVLRATDLDVAATDIAQWWQQEKLRIRKDFSDKLKTVFKHQPG